MTQSHNLRPKWLRPKPMLESDGALDHRVSMHATSRPTPTLPTTRFQGSKRKLLGWIGSHLDQLQFHTCLDAFSGSASVAYWLKSRGKAVVANDLLKSAYLTSVALVENDDARLTATDVAALLTRRDAKYDDFIARTFGGVYFTDEENQWLDVVTQNIARMRDRHKQAIAYYGLFQAALAKRPYNLFHRKNLYMRLASVPRSFGNKATWDKPFDEHFRHFAMQAGHAAMKEAPCRATMGDATDVAGDFDLVYIDPPYLNGRGVGADYLGYYHFLEGLCDYANWPDRIDMTSRHMRLHATPTPWTRKDQIHAAFERLFETYRRSIIVVSYRTDGIPTIDELAAMLRRYKSKVNAHQFSDGYKYALSTNAKSTEAMFIGE